jgi:hypothetical protein
VQRSRALLKSTTCVLLPYPPFRCVCVCVCVCLRVCTCGHSLLRSTPFERIQRTLLEFPPSSSFQPLPAPAPTSVCSRDSSSAQGPASRNSHAIALYACQGFRVSPLLCTGRPHHAAFERFSISRQQVGVCLCVHVHSSVCVCVCVCMHICICNEKNSTKPRD